MAFQHIPAPRPPETPAEGPRRGVRRRVGAWLRHPAAGVVAGLLAGIVVVVGVRFHLDYVAFLPGGATDTGMIPDSLPDELRARLLPASVMGPPAVFLASAEAEGVTGQRIVATEFDRWLAEFRAGHLLR